MKKNKILKTFIAIVLLISLEMSVIAASTGVVNADTVRVREKPSTVDSDIVGLVSIGKKVTIIGEEDNWYKIKGTDDHGNNIVGYIRKDLLTVNGETTTITPSENNDKQDEIEKPEENNNSTTTETPTKNEETDNNEDTPKETTTEQPAKKDEVNFEKNDISISTINISGNVYAGKKVQLTEKTKIKILPLANSSNIAELQANTEVTVLEVINKWCRIETGEYVGWVRIDQ